MVEICKVSCKLWHFCYLINLAMIYLILSINNEWLYFAQLCGMGAYTVSGFILNKLWVMK